jgi:hypothetical protein
MAQRWHRRAWRLIDLTRSLRARADENSVMVQGLINKAFVAPAERKAWTLGVPGSRIRRGTSSEVSKYQAINSGQRGAAQP